MAGAGLIYLLTGAALAGSMTVLGPAAAGGISNDWTVLDWADASAEYDPNSVGTMSGSGSTLTCTVNDGVGRTDVGGGVGVYYDWYDLEGNQVWDSGSSETEWPWALTIIVEALDTVPNNSELAVVAVIVDGNGNIGSGVNTRLGIGVDFQSATPRRIATIGTSEVYGTANADMRTSVLTLAAVGVATSADLAARQVQYIAVTEVKSDKSILNHKYDNLGLTAWTTAASGDGPALFVGCVALAAMAGEETASFHVGYQWMPALVNPDDTILLPSEI